MRHRAEASPVSFKVHAGRLPARGMTVVVEADPGQREALAAWHDLVSVESYRAELTVSPWKRHGVRVSGKVVADITQECVVTLDPVRATIDEAVEGIFLPEDSRLARGGFEDGGEVLLDAEGPDGPETFSGDTIDVGALAEEFFALAIDPYPRKSGAVLPADAAGNDDDEPDGPLQEKLRALSRKS